jgi:hypothetical protein
VYRAARTKADGVTDPSIEQKIMNSTPLTLIEDTENIINKFLEEFDFIEKPNNFKQEFTETWKQIKKEKRSINMIKNQ